MAYREQDDGLVEDLQEVLDAAFERPRLNKVTEHHDGLDRQAVDLDSLVLIEKHCHAGHKESSHQEVGPIELGGAIVLKTEEERLDDWVLLRNDVQVYSFPH